MACDDGEIRKVQRYVVEIGNRASRFQWRNGPVWPARSLRLALLLWVPSPGFGDLSGWLTLGARRGSSPGIVAPIFINQHFP